ncbi:MAG: tetratricopeptide repeat protein [Bacteroidia bacterium]|nr:tetratricopeptide repeat protein [Bacteroidia bacterium]
MEIFEIIHRYLHHHMSDEEKQQLEERLRNDPEFRAEVTQKLKTLEALGRQEVRHRASEAFEKMEIQRKWRSLKIYSATGVAAALALLVAFSLHFWNPASPDLEQLYASHYVFPHTGSRTDPNEMDSLWLAALDYYEKPGSQDFEMAVQAFESLLGQKDFAHQSEANFLLGISWLELDQPEKAVNALQKVNPDSNYGEDARFYLGLTYLRLEEVGEAKGIFEKMLEIPKHKHQEEARVILKDLN